MSENLRVNEARFWSTLEVSNGIGANRGTGVKRLAFTPEDKAMRDVFVQWCREAGCEITIDRVGNIFARRAGTHPDLNPVAMGSHLDTQVNGGRYDGILGVLGGLEVIRTLNDNGMTTLRPVEVIVWSNEEGARFVPTMGGSAAFCGNWDLDFILQARDDEGTSFEQALQSVGYNGDAPLPSRELDTYLELHIEQGPVLDAEKKQVGVVTGGYAVRSLVLEIVGETAHVGPTPMDKRHNAIVGAAYVITALNEIGWKYHDDDAKTTTSRIVASPNKQGIISEHAELMVDLRHPSTEGAEQMLAELMQAIRHAEQRAQVCIRVVKQLQYGLDSFDPDVIEVVRRNTEQLGYSAMEIKSQAGHDAYQVALVAPTAMIFTPCDLGYSHNEKEDATAEQLRPGLNVLLHSVLERACRPQ
ncbi:Zn-dependent hydrolase [Allopusillimonas ginsengisoli]|uniref:Zn-dependent hydrolase n=1 Tax=Allopusillimonas ginsengisoli TaxID=453575 RepID=UPI001020A1A6|nr:Zn-dependent hydrolase [Allopusillimonas ginsengisoli]TEA78818.1 Zn-dependent hydrolase [Allopusillimonas ginsengisoli]